jgi:hypothetical protein
MALPRPPKPAHRPFDPFRNMWRYGFDPVATQRLVLTQPRPKTPESTPETKPAMRQLGPILCGGSGRNGGRRGGHNY